MNSSTPAALPRTGPRLLAGVGALPDLGMALLYILTWISPLAIEEKMVSYLVLVLLLEFIVIHSAAFMGAAMFSDYPKWKRVLAVVGLGFFYTLFVGAFAASFDQWWPLGAFWILIGNRLLAGLLNGGPTDEQRNATMVHWAASVASYLAAVFAGVMLPLPKLGLTEEVRLLQGFEGGGEWIDAPETAIASGAIYFTLIGIAQLFNMRAKK